MITKGTDQYASGMRYNPPRVVGDRTYWQTVIEMVRNEQERVRLLRVIYSA